MTLKNSKSSPSSKITSKSTSSKKSSASTKSTSKKPKWTVRDWFHTGWLKIYPEMCKGFVVGMSHEAMKQLLFDTLAPLAYWDYNDVAVHANVHYNDFNHDDPIAPSSEKPHAHIAVQFKPSLRIRIGTFFSYLETVGVIVRDEDYPMLQKDGFILADARRANNGAFRSWVVYGSHETYTAKETEGKTQYPRSEAITNIPPEDLAEIYRLYFETEEADKVNDKYVAKLSEHFYKAGYAHTQDFEDIFNSYTPLLQVRLNSYKKMLHTFYAKGATDYINSPEAVNYEKIVVYLYGAQNLGKTVSSVKALERIGYKPYKVKGGGDGKMEQISVANDSIVFSDTTVPEILSTCEDGANVFKCRYYNRFFFGSLIIITSNTPIVKFYEKNYKPYGVDYGAFRSRIFSVKANDDGRTITIDGDTMCYYRRGNINRKLSVIKSFLSAYEAVRNEYMDNLNEPAIDLLSDPFFASHLSDDDIPEHLKKKGVVHRTNHPDGYLEVNGERYTKDGMPLSVYGL